MAGKNAACFSDGPSDFRLSPFHGVKIKNIELVMVLLTIIATYSKSSSRPVVGKNETVGTWESPISKGNTSFQIFIFWVLNFKGVFLPTGPNRDGSLQDSVVNIWCVFLFGGAIFLHVEKFKGECSRSLYYDFLIRRMNKNNERDIKMSSQFI